MRAIHSKVFVDIMKKSLPFVITFCICLLFFSTYIYFSISDSENMLNLSVSIYELKDLSLAVNINTMTGEHALDYSKYGLGLPLFMVPFLFLNDLLHAVFGNINSNIVLGLPNMVILALTAQTVFAILSEMDFSYRKSLFLSVFSIFGTFAYPYGNMFLSEPLQALALTSAFFFLYTAKKGAACPYIRLGIGGALYSFSIFTKATNLIFLPLLLFYVFISFRGVLKKQPVRELAAFLVPVSVSGLIMAYLNFSRFGSPFDFGYGNEAHMFINPVLSGAYNLLFNTDKGLIFFTPVMLLLPYALWRFVKTFKWEGILIGALFLSNLLIYSAWWAWEGGESWGPRFLLPIIPLTIVPFASILNGSLSKVAVTVLLIAGFLVNLLGVMQDFTGFHYIIMQSAGNIRLDIARSKRDYIDLGFYKQPPPYVVSSVLPEFGVLRGHLWLQRARLEGWMSGEGLSMNNRTLQSPPWKEKYPEFGRVDIGRFPEEIKARLECPPPLILGFLCKVTPSVPYYYNALMSQAEKAEVLGRGDEAQRLRRKALKESWENKKRAIQMSR